MDRNAIDHALHEIHQMISVSITALEPIRRKDPQSEMFELPETNVDLISFCVFDLEKRVKGLRETLAEREQ